MYKPRELAKLLGVTVKTLQRWDKSGRLPAKRSLTNYRYYTEEDLRIAQGLKPLEKKRLVVIYCRVSSNAQKPELKNQVSAMQSFCLARGLAINKTITEIGGGLNFKRFEVYLFNSRYAA
jgi:predicted site-specific integrase-resolvase